jgi:hypothetical protein
LAHVQQPPGLKTQIVERREIPPQAPFALGAPIQVVENHARQSFRSEQTVVLDISWRDHEVFPDFGSAIPLRWPRNLRTIVLREVCPSLSGLAIGRPRCNHVPHIRMDTLAAFPGSGPTATG